MATKIDESAPISEIGGNNRKSLDDNPEEGVRQEAGKADKNIKENILIHTMPRKFKVSTDGRQSGKTKIIGSIIMIAGALILIALIYLAYIYLIKFPAQPKAPKPTPQIEVTVEEEEEKIEEEKPKEIPKKEEVLVEKEEIIATTTPEEAPATSTSGMPEEGVFQDSDKDGLSNLEENIFGSNLNLTDSDNDGYDDGAEVEKLYNPAGSGLLADNQNIGQYQSSAFGYQVLRPVNWFKQSIGDGSSVIFGTTDGSFIQIISQANEDKEDIAEWFSTQFPEEEIGEEDIITGSGWQGIFHENKKIFYLTGANKENIFIISYAPEPENNLNYYNIFKIAISSFSLVR